MNPIPESTGISGMPGDLLAALRCPGKPDTKLELQGDYLICADDNSDEIFPIVAGIPVLINEQASVFRIADFLEQADDPRAGNTDAPGLKSGLRGSLQRGARAITPPRTRYVAEVSGVDALKTILSKAPEASILVIGAGDTKFDNLTGGSILYTDVVLSSSIHLIADAHDIPFANDTFDAVISVAVLEHVADPFQCVSEIQRVLAPRGWIYAVTPFMQQVHMGGYDFTRFTAIGHRRLFRWFDEIRSGVSNGPGSVMAWSIEYFLSSMSERPTARSLLRTIGRFLGWPFLLFDGFLARKRGSLDCASGFFFFGQLREEPISDREIVNTYRGLN